MIIGNDNKKNQVINPTIEKNRTTYHTNVTSKDEMADKSFEMLEERYRNGLISLDEYTRQCNKLNNLRQK